MAKNCGSKWELGKMDKALIRMWQKKGGSKWELGKMDRALIRMWQKGVGIDRNVARSVGLNGYLAKI